MAEQTKKYWKGPQERQQTPQHQENKENEFQEEVPVEELLENNFLSKKTPRRNFLKYLGFSTTAATVAASCEIPVKKAIPYVIKPDEIIPGTATWYASSFEDGQEYCDILVKTREGRPIKIEGNKESPLTEGGTSARVQASVLNLYDTTRLKTPKINQESSSWEVVDAKIKKKLESIQQQDGNIVILSRSTSSPSTRQAIKDFQKKYPNTKHITYDALSTAAISDAHKTMFGKRFVPSYRFDKAKTIVSFGADFLGTWISPTQYIKQYSKGRKVSSDNPSMSRHIQFESLMSLTGTNADKRHRIHPSQQGAAIAQLYNKIAKLAGAKTYSAPTVKNIDKALDKTAQELWQNRKSAIVVADSNDPAVQNIVNAINHLLKSYGNTIDYQNPTLTKDSQDQDVQQLIKDMKAGNVDGLILNHANPAYDLPNGEEFKKGLQNVDLSVSFNDRMDETTSHVQYACPDHHYLEGWNDLEPQTGYYSISQPAIRPLFNTRASQESLLMWSGQETSYHDYIKQYWKNNLYSQQNQYSTFQSFWEETVQQGVFDNRSQEQMFGKNHKLPKTKSKTLSTAFKQIPSPKSEDLQLQLYQKVGIGDGSFANNPWLQEMPDPVSKITWDNYATVSPKFAKSNNLKEGDVIEVATKQYKVKLPVHIQPGQAEKTIGAAVGYGRTQAGKGGNDVGENVYPFAHFANGYLQYQTPKLTFSKTGQVHELANTQEHHSLDGHKQIEERQIIKETTFDEYKKNPYAGNMEYYDEHHDKPKETTDHGTLKEIKDKTLYDDWEYDGHRWGMAIDLNACIGCGACIVACQAENNIPVVGKREVKRHHEMHWIRIDRYYKGGEENPEVAHQPMLCQHCDHAPCENVCPVAATNHSDEGINQMIYNRCVGTKYCLNNCPYKVRRFNWYDYAGTDSFPWNEHTEHGAMDDRLTRMVLNPDVTVRSRGVMEKCTFNIQRIQQAKLEAKRENRQLEDGDVEMACQQACPADAFVFGDMNDPDSEVSKAKDDERQYHLLNQLHTMPSVSYLTKVRNKEKDEKDEKSGNEQKKHHS